MKRELTLIVSMLLVIIQSSVLHQSHTHHDKAIIKEGSSNLVLGITIHGAIIMSDFGDSKHSVSQHQNTSSMVGNTTNSNTNSAIVSATEPETPAELLYIAGRIKNAHILMSLLPFGLTEWPAVFTSPCPHYPDGHKTERGLALAHYRIWHDFVYFDNQLIYRYNQTLQQRRNSLNMTGGSRVNRRLTHAVTPAQTNFTHSRDIDKQYAEAFSSANTTNIHNRNSRNNITATGGNHQHSRNHSTIHTNHHNNHNRTTSSHKSEQHSSSNNNPNYLYSEDGHYYIDMTNGAKYKYGQLFIEDDIMVIFEDDAESAIIETNITIIEELGAMKVDLLFLGWCDGRMARPVPLCAHAYAITRAGARKLLEHYEPCGKAIDEQFVIFAKNKWITYRTAHGHSYKTLNSNYPVHGDKTFGIFHQKKKTLGSINGHRRALLV